MNPHEAIEKYGKCLTRYELEEIKKYDEIFYCGQDVIESKIDGIKGSSYNDGYDKKDGMYRLIALDHIFYRWKLLIYIGKGAFGIVVKAYDYKTDKIVALKIIRNEPRFHKQGKIEIEVLRNILESDPDGKHSIVKICDNVIFRNHLIITFELLGPNLYLTLKNRKFKGLNIMCIKSFSKTIIKGLCLLKKLNIVHCDLKPENILITGDLNKLDDEIVTNDTKIIDLGSACYHHEKIHSYIQSRYYRAPEIVLGLGYGPSIDMFSLVCIIYEMMTGRVLFKAKNEFKLLGEHLKLLGMPPEHIYSKSSRKDEFFSDYNEPQKNVVDKEEINSKNLETLIPGANGDMLDFMRMGLKWENRMTTEEALNHKWLN